MVDGGKVVGCVIDIDGDEGGPGEEDWNMTTKFNDPSPQNYYGQYRHSNLRVIWTFNIGIYIYIYIPS